MFACCFLGLVAVFFSLQIVLGSICFKESVGKMKEKGHVEHEMTETQRLFQTANTYGRNG